ncbi:MAG: hypothetical protein HUJ25_13400 [Crocinitomicaceae bacterium]|nr:hypothetical protein [Crocinitomicaceae bacterium]
MNMKLLLASLLLWAPIIYAQISEDIYNENDSIISSEAYTATTVILELDLEDSILFWNVENEAQETFIVMNIM